MSTPSEARTTGDPRDFFAEERTFLAWLRTGLALMTFGFVVARFGLYLAEFHAGHNAPSTPQGKFSLWAGTTFIVVGVVTTLFSVQRHLHVIQELNTGQFVGRSSRPAIILAVFLALVGAAMAFHLIFV